MLGHTIPGHIRETLEPLCQNSLSCETLEYCVMQSRFRKLLFRKEVVRIGDWFRTGMSSIVQAVLKLDQSSLKTRLNGVRTCRQIKLRWCPAAVSGLCQNPSDSRHWRYA
jgi:hypothetical protein